MRIRTLERMIKAPARKIKALARRMRARERRIRAIQIAERSCWIHPSRRLIPVLLAVLCGLGWA